jgi:hypothetical protein
MWIYINIDGVIFKEGIDKNILCMYVWWILSKNQWI